MKNWTRIPVFRLFVPFSLGILAGLHTASFSLSLGLTFLIATALHILFTVRRYATGKHAQRWLAGIPAFAAWLSAGMLSAVLHLGPPAEIKNVNPGSIIVLVESHVSWSQQAVRFRGTVKMSQQDSSWSPEQLPVMVRISNTKTFIPEPGDLVLLHAVPHRVKGPANPGQFDYRKYLEKKGIRHQVYCNGSEAFILKKQYEKNLVNLALPLRNAAAATLHKALPDSAELGIAAALVLGEERWLDEQVEAGYAGAGVLHVLCVSGMHVVLLLSLLEKLLSLVPLPPKYQPARHILMILFTWYYTSLTGFSPSIVRAAVMMTLLLVGKLLNKAGNMPNALAGCAMLMLVTAPGYMFDAGFQLSFLAVIGIVFIHERLRWIVEPSTASGRAIRDLVSVTIAAQAATFPISLYYFGQFPNYFILANLLIVPLSTGVLYLGMLMVITQWIPGIETIMSWLTSFSVQVLNRLTLWIADLPYAVSKNIYITVWEFLLLGFLVYSAYRLLSGRSYKRLCIFLTTFILLMGSFKVRMAMTSQQQIITVYQVRKETMITVVKGSSGIYLGTTADSLLISKTITGHMNQLGVSQLERKVFIKGNLIRLSIGPQKVVCITGKLKDQDLAMLQQWAPDHLVMTGSVPVFTLNKTLEVFRGSDIKIWSTSTSGAWMSTVNR
jgi:competence protein ComEC